MLKKIKRARGKIQKKKKKNLPGKTTTKHQRFVGKRTANPDEFQVKEYPFPPSTVQEFACDGMGVYSFPIPEELLARIKKFLIEELKTEQHPPVFGCVPARRIACFVKDKHIPGYRYSRKLVAARKDEHGENFMPDPLKDFIEWVNGITGQNFNSVLVNEYGPGARIRAHSDDEPEISPVKSVFCLSIGDDVVMKFKKLNEENGKYYQFINITLKGGYGYSMSGKDFQKYFQHEIGPMEPETRRFSLTLREIFR